MASPSNLPRLGRPLKRPPSSELTARAIIKRRRERATQRKRLQRTRDNQLNTDQRQLLQAIFTSTSSSIHTQSPPDINPNIGLDLSLDLNSPENDYELEQLLRLPAVIPSASSSSSTHQVLRQSLSPPRPSFPNLDLDADTNSSFNYTSTVLGPQQPHPLFYSLKDIVLHHSRQALRSAIDPSQSPRSTNKPPSFSSLIAGNSLATYIRNYEISPPPQHIPIQSQFHLQ